MNSPSSSQNLKQLSTKDDIDEVGVLKQKKILQTFSGDEVLQISLDVIKINEYGSKDYRQIVITNRRILLMNQFTIRRKVSLKFLIGITLSLRSYEFILHFSNEYDDDDLRLYSEKRSKIIEVLVKVISTDYKGQIPSYQINDPLLKKYQNFKDDRKKGRSKIPLLVPTVLKYPLKQKFLFYQPERERQEAIQEREKARSSQHKQKDSQENLKYSRNKQEKVTFEDFSIEKIIAQGSLCQVLMNQQQKILLVFKKSENNKVYCLKSIPKYTDQMDPAQKEQVDVSEFFNNLNSYINNPFILPLEYAFGSVDTYFFISEFIQAGDLCNLLIEEGCFNEHRVRFYGSQILLALEHLHQNNYIYKDLRLENILMDQSGYIYLTDFGKARSKFIPSYGCYQTLENIGLFSKSQLAPEILAEANKYEQSSDYWQLGIVIYEMIYSHTPFTADNDEQIFDFIINSNLVFPDQPQISPYCQDLIIQVLNFIDQLLQKDPKRRLGYKGGVSEIQNHSWFQEVDWKMTYDKKVKPVYRPKQETQQKAQQEITNSFQPCKNENLIFFSEDRKLSESQHTRSSQQLLSS